MNIFLPLIFTISGAFGATNYNDECLLKHGTQLRVEIDQQLALNLQGSVAELLIESFKESGILISASDVMLLSIDNVGHLQKEFIFTVHDGADIYNFSATVEYIHDLGHIDRLWNMQTTDNAVVNSIGVITQPASQVECTAYKYLYSIAEVRNADTGIFLDTVEISNNPGPFPSIYPAYGTITFFL